MPTLSRQTELLGQFEKTRDALHTFASSRTSAQKAEQGTFDQWAAKDLLANIAFWMRYMVERMDIYARDEAPPRHVDFDTLNRTAFETNQHRGWQELLDEAYESLDRLILAVRSRTDAQLNVNNGYGDISDENPGGPLSGEIRANGFLYPLEEMEKFYARSGETEHAQAVRAMLHESRETLMSNAPALINAQALSAQQEAENKPLVIDVRGPKEYAEGHIQGAVNIPLASLTKTFKKLPHDQPIVTYCNMHHPGESRGERAAALLRDNGYQAQTLQGGFLGWKDAGHAVESASDL